MINQIKDELLSILMIVLLCVGVIMVSPFMLVRYLRKKMRD